MRAFKAASSIFLVLFLCIILSSPVFSAGWFKNTGTAKGFFSNFFTAVGNFISTIWNLFTGSNNTGNPPPSQPPAQNPSPQQPPDNTPSQPNQPPDQPAADTDISGRTFIILECSEYGENDLKGDDALIFRDKMKKSGASCISYIKDYDVNDAALNPNSRIDYLYYTGHGYYNCLVPSNHSAVYSSQFKARNNVSHLIFASCLTVTTSWGKCFDGSLKTVLGYFKTSYDGPDDTVAKKFALLLKDIPVSSSEQMKNAWVKANSINSLKDRWSAICYDSNGKLNYYKPSVVQNIKSTRSPIPGSYTEFSTPRGIVKLANTTSRSKFIQNFSSLTGYAESVQLSEHSVVSAALNNKSSSRSSSVSHNSYAEILPSGALIYSKNSDMSHPIHSDETDAISTAWEFVDNNGGMPQGARVSQALPIEYYDINTGHSGVCGYLVSIEHSVEDSLAAGNEGIKVIVDASGVSYYERMWTELEPSRAQTPEVLSESAAVKKAAAAITASVKSYKNTDITVYSVEPGYTTGSMFENTRSVKQVYVLHSSEGDFLIDAVTGALVW